MAKKDKSAEGEEAPKKKKKPIVPIVLVVVGMVAGKMFFGGGGEKSAAELAAEKKAAEAALIAKCAAWNGGVRPEPKLMADASEDESKGESKGAAGAGVTRVRLISSTGPTLKMAAEDATETTETTETTEAVKPGPVIDLSSTTINLADGRYLKVGFAVQMPEGADAQLAKDEGKGARAVDIAISKLQSMTMKQLMPPSARIQTKYEIGADVCATYEGEILTVYFTEFVMQ